MRTGRTSVKAGALLACALLFSVGAAPGRSGGFARGQRAGDRAAVPCGRARSFATGPRTAPSFLPPLSPLLPAPALSSAGLSPVRLLLCPVPRGRHLSQPPPVLLPARCPASRRAVCLCGAVGRGVVQWSGDGLLGGSEREGEYGARSTFLRRCPETKPGRVRRAGRLNDGRF